jgi:hypothetical protein
MKEESSELKGKADPNGAKWMSQNKGARNYGT